MPWNDTRAQSLQVGAVLLFSIAIILLASWQAFVIPNQNEEIEFNHNQELQQQLTELRTTANSMIDASVTRAATADLGVRYPSRVLFVNPPPATGAIRTVDTTDPAYNITIRNGTPEDTNLRQLWGDLGPGGNSTISFNTGAIAYDPGYNEYQYPPRTVYEHSVLFNTFETEDETLPLTEQSIIRNDRLTLVTLNGTVSENRVDTASVDFEPLSTQTRTVEITANNGPLTLEFPTRLAVSEWRSLLGNEYTVTPVEASADPFDSDDDIQTIKIQPPTSRDTYQLRLAKVGVGDGTTQPEPAYVTTVNRDSGPVTAGDLYEFTVEPRDKYNKPKSGVTVDASVSEGSLDSSSVETGPDGQATFVYNSSGVDAGNKLIDVSITGGNNATSPENLSLSVDVDPPQTGAGGNGTTGAGGNGTVGVGGGLISDYGQVKQDTFSVPNGRWTDITCTDQLILSNGQPASKPNGNNLQGDVIRFSGSLNNSENEQYTIDIRLARKTDGSWNIKRVVINDGNGNNQNAELGAAAARRIYERGRADILNLSNYDKGQGSDWSTFLAQIRALEDDPFVVWQTSRVTGRVDVELACDSPPTPPGSGVSAIDGTTPSGESSALKFDIQVASGTTKTITEVNVTTPGNQNDGVQDAMQLRRTGNNDEVRLTPSNTNGVNQSGRLKQNVKLDGTNYSLDTNAVFSDGAVLDVDMGDIDGKNVKWTYELTDSKSNADAVVTFYFQDSTQFNVYLRVTNVNS